MNKKSNMYMNKKGNFINLFVFMIVTVVIIFFSGIMIYIGIVSQNALEENMADADLHSNVTEVIGSTIGETNNSFSALYWIAIFLIVGMVVSIFVGSYMVTTKPIVFFPYIFIVIIAIVVAVAISIAYTDFKSKISDNEELTEIFNNFIGANEVLAYLPLWICAIGIVGGIIMASRLGSGDAGGGVYYG